MEHPQDGGKTEDEQIDGSNKAVGIMVILYIVAIVFVTVYAALKLTTPY